MNVFLPHQHRREDQRRVLWICCDVATPSCSRTRPPIHADSLSSHDGNRESSIKCMARSLSPCIRHWQRLPSHCHCRWPSTSSAMEQRRQRSRVLAHCTMGMPCCCPQACQKGTNSGSPRPTRQIHGVQPCSTWQTNLLPLSVP